MATHGFFLEAEAGVDPEFDDMWADTDLLLHEIEASGSIPIHPNGDRRHGRDDPVPLLTSARELDPVGKLKIDWAQYLKQRVKWEQEREAAEERWNLLRQEQLELAEGRAQQAAAHASQRLGGDAMRPASVSPESPSYSRSAELRWLHELMRNMHPEKPIQRGQGRVFENYVMVNESDLAKWNEDRLRRQLAEVWRSSGFVIFRLR